MSRRVAWRNNSRIPRLPPVCGFAVNPRVRGRTSSQNPLIAMEQTPTQLSPDAGCQCRRERRRIVNRQYALNHRVRDDPRSVARGGRFVSTVRARDLLQTEAFHADYIDRHAAQTVS